MNDPREKLVRLSENFIESGFFLLLVGAPMAYGAVERWAYRSIQAISLLILLAFVFHRRLTARAAPVTLRAKSRLLLPLYLFLAAFLLVAAFQLLPLPAPLLRALNPSVYYYRLLSGELPRFSTLSIAPALTAEGLLKALSYFIVFLVLAEYSPVERSKRAFVSRLAAAMVICGFILSVLGIIHLYARPDRLFGLFSPSNRGPFGLFVNRNHFANYAAMTILLAVGMLLSFIPGGRKDSFREPRARILALDARLALLTFIILAILTGLLLSASRGGAMAAAAGLAFLFFLDRSRGTQGGKKLLAWLPLLLAFLLPVVSYFSFRPLADKLPRIPEAVTGRGMIWRDSWNIFLAHPWFGTGLETFEYAHARTPGAFAENELRYPPHRRRRAEHAENEYLQLIMETGLAGFIPLAGAVIWYFRLVFRRKAGRDRKTVLKTPGAGRRFIVSRRGLLLGGAAAAAAFLTHCLVDFVLRVPANALTFSALAAMSLAVPFKRDRENYDLQQPSTPL